MKKDTEDHLFKRFTHFFQQKTSPFFIKMGLW